MTHLPRVIAPLAVAAALVAGLVVGAPTMSVAAGRDGQVARAPRPGPDVVRGSGRVSTTGTDSVFVIRADWTAPDATSQADVDHAFTLANAWFDEVSHGQFGIVTTSAPRWVTIPTSDCTDKGVATLMARAIAAQRTDTPSFDPKDFKHIVVYFPHQAVCDYYSGEGRQPGKYVWLNGVFPDGYSSLEVRTTTHELGHNLGLDHSKSIACTGPNGVPVTLSHTCAHFVEYGDVADQMGNNDFFNTDDSYVVPAFNVAQQSRLGWLGSSVATVTPCQDVTLSPYEGTSGVRGARFAGAGGATYWLEWRQPAPGTVDDGLPPTLRDGPLLHVTIPHDLSPYLLDGRPDAAGDMSDAAIPVGGTVTTPDGITIATTDVSATTTVHLSTALPSAPAKVAARGIAGGALVGWTPPACVGSSPITGYRVDYQVRGTSLWHPAGTAGPTRHTFKVGGLPTGHAYVVRVTAVNGAGAGVLGATSAALRPLNPSARLRASAPRRLVAGRSARQTAVLVDPRSHRSIAGARVVLQSRSGHGRWHGLTAVRTSRGGVATARTAPRVSTRYRWVYVGDSRHGRTLSSVVRVAVAPLIRVSETTRTVHPGGTVAIYGRTLPARPGIHVVLQARVGGTWVPALATTTAVHTQHGHHVVGYVFTLHPHHQGRLVLRVVSRPSATNAAGLSHPLVLTVK